MEAVSTPSGMVKIIIAENQVIILHALAALIAKIDGIDIIGLVTDGRELIDKVVSEKPDVILMNLRKPGLNTFEIARILDEKVPWVKIISLTRFNHPIFIREMLKLGVKGFLSTDCQQSELHEGILSVYNGKTYFCSICSAVMVRAYVQVHDDEEVDLRAITHREIEIIRQLANGKTTREISALMFISAKTVERHKSNILKKLKSKNTAQMVKVAIDHGLIT